MTTRWKQYRKLFVIGISVLLGILGIILLALYLLGVFSPNRTLSPTTDRSIHTDEGDHILKKIINISDSYSNEIDSKIDNIRNDSTTASAKSHVDISSENGTYDHQNKNNTQGSHYEGVLVDNTASTTTQATTPKSEVYQREQWIRPAKIHHLPLQHDDLLYESKRNGSDTDFIQQQRITGNYRNSSSRIWDPHPEYKIDAFGHHLHLVLYQDASFMPDTLKVTHVYANRTEHFEKDEHQKAKLEGCFYKGVVQGDEESFVLVSLCNGMRGTIRTSFGSFFIEPMEPYTKEDSNILHRIRRESKRHKDHHASGKHDPSCPLDEHLKEHGSINFDDDDDDDWTLKNPNDVAPPKSRRKRNINNDRQYTVEVVIAVDRKMEKFHGEQTEEYVLTLMQIVSNIYADASIGNSINVTLVNIMIIKDDLSITYLDKENAGVSASLLLKRFCSFIAKKDVHYDTAILLTREQICRNSPETKCDTLGLAELGTVCKKQSCSIVQDNGLPAAFTIAHELGHVLSMPHDDDVKCANFHKDGKRKLHIMSSTMGEEIHPWSWSDCSRHFVTEFLEKDEISCLTNKPNDIMRSKSRHLPGEVYDLDQQCELIHGANAKHCNISSEDERECVRLWCFDKVDSHDCRSSNLPWADGTPCFDGRHWCQKGFCVMRDLSILKPIDGGWSPFSEYSECSRTCGGGIQESTRECNSPTPENGGKYCPGDRKRWRSCNTHDCEEGVPDFREKQCSDFNGNNFALEGVGNDVRWVPKYGVSPKDECKLFCRVENSAAYFLLNQKVKDGTTCSYDSFDKCVNGMCRPAGCDNKLNSLAKLDKCGVCQGQNDTCIEIIKTVYRSNLAELPSAGTTWYYRVAKIPKGAANIEITQPDFTMENYIVLVNDKNEYLLNGNKLINTFPKRFPYGGITFDYTGSNSTLERVNTTYSRKIERDLYIEILSLPRQSDRGDGVVVQYKYTQETESSFEWDWSDWTLCNSECNGTKQKVPICVRRGTRQEQPPHRCDIDKKPRLRTVTVCNEGCDFRLETKRGECNCTAGGIRKLYYQCKKVYNPPSKSEEIVDKSHCEDGVTRPGQELCPNECGHWQYSEWSECEGSCANAKKTRTAHCEVNGVRVEDKKCFEKKQSLQMECSEGCYDYSRGPETPRYKNPRINSHHHQYGQRYPPSHRGGVSNHIPNYSKHHNLNWRYTEWSECIDCRKNRTVYCPDPMKRCSPNVKPLERANCCRAKYKMSWTNCNVHCGKGKRYRKLDCWLFSENKKWIRPIDYSRCKDVRRPQRKMHAEKECDMGACVWAHERWTPCDRNCTTEFTTRRVFCLNEKSKRKLPEKHCRTRKPYTKRRCFKQRVTKKCECDGFQYQSTVHYMPSRSGGRQTHLLRCPKPTTETRMGRCVPSSPRCVRSCSDIRRFTRNDGEYPMTIRGKNVSIYCHNLVDSPKEYITLPHYQDNYAYFSQATAKDPTKCHTPTDRNEIVSHLPDRHTTFSRIRINLSNLRVIANDYTFATTTRGVEPVPYGSAGDCYSPLKECPRGSFSINLKNTGFTLHSANKWRSTGQYSVIKWFRRLEPPYQEAGAGCGGHCGQCRPAQDLQLDVL